MLVMLAIRPFLEMLSGTSEVGLVHRTVWHSRWLSGGATSKGTCLSYAAHRLVASFPAASLRKDACIRDMACREALGDN